ncbi:MAG: hypothetical protein ACLU30_18340 [Odoribacter splanchnicus]
MTTLRFKMVEEAIGRKAVEVKAPAERPAEYFENMFLIGTKCGNICRKLVSKR